MSKLLIKNGRVMDPETGRDSVMDVLVEGTRITRIGKIDDSEVDEIYDAAGKLVVPGIIDLHAHLRDMEQSDKETISTGTEAALKGGITTVFAMPNTRPPLDRVENIQKYKDIISEDARITVNIAGAITRGLNGRGLADISSYSDLDIRFITDDGFDVNNEYLLEMAYREANANSIILMTHPEVNNISPDGVINEGRISNKLSVPGQSNQKEFKAVERAIKIADKTDGRAHITHISAKESVDLIRKAKADNQRITCDVTPHHITFTEDIVPEKLAKAKVNPPLRTEDDRQALINGIKDGTIDAIVTDHAPHSVADKQKDLMEAPFGFSGFEILVPAVITELYFKAGMDLLTVIRLMTLNPARIANIGKGRMQELYPSDIAIIDLETERPVDASLFVSKGKNTPFDGMKLKGWIEATIYKGKVYKP